MSPPNPSASINACNPPWTTRCSTRDSSHPANTAHGGRVDPHGFRGLQPCRRHRPRQRHPGGELAARLAWKCSDKQKDLILKLVEEHQLDKTDVEALAVERFGKGVRILNKVEASGLIDELLDTHSSGQRQVNRRNGSAYNGGNGRSAA